jgi:hypothetical protein
MKDQLRDRLESAAQRLDMVLDTFPGVPGGDETTLLLAADDIAQALHILKHGEK